MGRIAMEYGRYQILNQLGQGGMATVYLAEDPLLQRLVAVKVIQAHLSSNASLMDRFTVEAKTIAGLRHVNIVEVFDFGVQDDSQYLVMEYIDGQNLQAFCSALGGKGMPNTATAAIICQAAEGLTSAEKNGVVHRDIKPENLMFNSEGTLKIADFGIAHIADEQSRTQTGAVLGSPNFMSPEQIEGAKPTHKTDIFSLGGVFYYCLAGKLPFTGPSIPVTMRNICERQPPPILELNPDADPILVALVDTLLQKQPENRGEGARWLANQLRAYLNQHQIVDIVDHARTFINGLNLKSNPPPATGSGTTPSKSAIKTGPGLVATAAGRGNSGVSKTGLATAGGTRTNTATGGRTGAQPTTGAKGPSSRSPLVWMGALLAFCLLILAGTMLWTRLHHGQQAMQNAPEKPIATQAVPAPTSPPAAGSALSTQQPTAASASASQAPAEPLPAQAMATLPAGKQGGKTPKSGVQKGLEPRSDGSQTAGTASDVPGGAAKDHASNGQAGFILIKSAPPFAAIIINGKPAGDTPMNDYMEVPLGKCHVEVISRVFPPFDTMLTITPGFHQEFKFILNR